MKLSRFATVLFVSSSLVGSLFAAAPMKEGNWQITMNMEMEGMPVKIPPVTIKQCLKKEDLNDPEKTLPKTTKDSSCKISDYKLEGNTVSWKVNCPKEKLTGTGEMTYEGNSAYSGKMDMDSNGQKMHMKMAGKRLGDCAD
jgi:hypothetical protein